MSKEQFWTLNIVGGASALALLLNLVVTHINAEDIRKLQNTQRQLAQAQQLQNTFQNLAIRVAQSAQADPALRSVLERQNLNVNLGNPGAAPKP